jgi:hypothetical protein
LRLNLAALLRDTGRHAEAEPLLREALATTERALGRDHPMVAVRLSNLAGVLRDTGRFAEAEPLMREAVAAGERALGRDHPDVAVGLNNLARLLHATDRFAEAEPLMREAVAILIGFEHTTGHRHPNRNVVLDNYRSLLAAMGRSEAEVRSTITSLEGEPG